MRAGLRTGQLGDDVGDRTRTGDPRHGLGHGRHLVVPGRRLVTAGMTMHTNYADWILQEYSWTTAPGLRSVRCVHSSSPAPAGPRYRTFRLPRQARATSSWRSHGSACAG